MFAFTQSTRIRQSPYHDAILKEGVAGFTAYNHMMLPTGYGNPMLEYQRLIHGVSMWDVAAERQVAMKGPDALKLAQVLSARDLSKAKVGQGKYVPICDHRGTLLNDPILLKIADDEAWLSIADSGILYWARSVAAERGMNVSVYEADVAPMAVQGPQAEDVMAAMFGEEIRATKQFAFADNEVDGIPVKVARSGWSKQGGFEIYLLDCSRGVDLWNAVRDAGRPYQIGPGTPNGMERIESGLLSWGGDTDDATNPFEVRMERFVSTEIGEDVIGVKALQDIAKSGPKRHQLGITIEAEGPLAPVGRWAEISADKAKVGDVTCSTWSPRLERYIGFALVSRDHAAGDEVEVTLPEGIFPARLSELPFI